MIFVYILLILFICLLIISIYYFMKNNNVENKPTENNNILKEEDTSFFPMIQIIENNDIVPSSKNLISNENITKALKTMDNEAPNAISIAKNITNSKKFDGKVLFSADIKEADKMIKIGKNKYIGTQIDPKKNKMMGRAENKFTGQTELTNETGLVKNVKGQQLVNAGMSAASMIVGQYYMNEIDNKLKEISDTLNDVANFQNSEYEGKMLQIMSKIHEIIENRDTILNNKKSIKNAYNDIKNIEAKCADLLGQANSAIKRNLVNEELNYKKYEEKIKKIEEWFLRQQLTQEMLLKIGDLRYVLANGSETSKLSHQQYNNYLKYTNDINEKLKSWHKTNIDKLGIDIENQRKKGSLFKVRENTIGKIKEEWNYKKLENSTVMQIISQTESKKFMSYDKDKLNESIVIQKYKGKYYNVPADNINKKEKN